MARTRTTNELMAALFTERQHPLRTTFLQWLNASKRFKTFAETYQTKIKAKISATREAESLRDLAFELETAYWLHQEPRLAVAYEQQTTGQTRRPDFTVAYTTKFTFSVEVTRIRSAPDDTQQEELTRESTKMQYVIANKLPQMLPGTINLLVIGTEERFMQSLDLNAIMLQFKKRAEAKDAQLFSRSGARDAADFFRAYHRLSAVLLHKTSFPGQPASASDVLATLWLNKEAKHPLPAPLQTILKTA